MIARGLTARQRAETRLRTAERAINEHPFTGAPSTLITGPLADRRTAADRTADRTADRRLETARVKVTDCLLRNGLTPAEAAQLVAELEQACGVWLDTPEDE